MIKLYYINIYYIMSTINSNGGFFDALNSSVVALNSGDIFEGVYNSCLNFSTIEISVKTNTIYDLSIVYSADGANDEFTETTSVVIVSTDTLFYKFEPKMRYFKIKLENTDVSNQTELSLQCLLKSSFVYSLASGGGGTSNVNIVSPLNGGAVDIAGSVSIAGSVAVTNSDITNIYNVVNSKTSSSLWNANVTGVNGVSTSVNLSTKNIKNLTFMGNCNGATLLTVQFSSDGSNWYDSQYAYTLSASGDVGFNIPCCPNYVRLKSSASVTATMLLNCC